jgi:preprotein translocase subunit SecD
MTMLAACSGGSSGPHASPAPDGAVVTARVTDQDLRPADVAIAREILRSRMAALGFSGSEVDYDTTRRLVIVHFPRGRTPSADLARLSVRTADLRFRLVNSVIPYSGSTAPGNGENTTCRGGAVVTPDRPARQVILADKDKTFCYLLGPTILTGRNIGSATAVVNSSSGAWQVDAHFTNNDFVTKVAAPNIGKQIAIVLDGVVQSAPTIQAGITGQDVTITGNFSSKDAHELALVLRYGALPFHLQFVSLTPGPG